MIILNDTYHHAFGDEPANPISRSPNVTLNEDGTLHAVINSASDSVHSGFFAAALQDPISLPQAVLGITRFRITFTHAGTFNHKCALHDNPGMLGQVIVLP